MIYKLTHAYTLDDKNYGIRTDFNIEQLNQACAYIQLIRDQLPELHCLQDDIGESEGQKILCDFYGMEIHNDLCEFDGVIDFYTNWEQWCVGWDKKYNKFAVENAHNRILKIIRPTEEALNNIDDTFSNHIEGADYKRMVLKSLNQLDAVISGEVIKEEWGWQTLSGESLTGQYFGFTKEKTLL